MNVFVLVLSMYSSYAFNSNVQSLRKVTLNHMPNNGTQTRYQEASVLSQNKAGPEYGECRYS